MNCSKIANVNSKQINKFTNMSTSFKEQIAPFRWVDHDNKSYSVCLDVGGWKDEIF